MSNDVSKPLAIEFRGCSFLVEHGPQDAFWSRMKDGSWERSTYDALDLAIDEDTTVIDLGAWIGPTVLYSAIRARRVIALEPDPVAAAALRRNLALNPDLDAKTTVLEKAVWREGGTMQMGSKHAQGDSMSSLVHDAPSDSWNVDCITPSQLADMVTDARKLFIKIDIEGAEYEVVPAFAPLIARDRLDVLLSFHPRFAAGGHPRFHKTFAMTRRIFQMFKGFDIIRVGRKRLLPAYDIKFLSALGLWIFEAKRSFLFSKK